MKDANGVVGKVDQRRHQELEKLHRWAFANRLAAQLRLPDQQHGQRCAREDELEELKGGMKPGKKFCKHLVAKKCEKDKHKKKHSHNKK